MTDVMAKLATTTIYPPIQKAVARRFNKTGLHQNRIQAVPGPTLESWSERAKRAARSLQSSAEGAAFPQRDA